MTLSCFVAAFVFVGLFVEIIASRYWRVPNERRELSHMFRVIFTYKLVVRGFWLFVGF